jgi:hypothetical protein
VGPVIVAENVGAIRSVDSGEESGACGDVGGVASAPENAGESDACSSVASGTTPAALMEAIDAAITALDAGEIDIARTRLKALAEAVRANPTSQTSVATSWLPTRHPCG